MVRISVSISVSLTNFIRVFQHCSGYGGWGSFGNWSVATRTSPSGIALREPLKTADFSPLPTQTAWNHQGQPIF